MGKEKKKSYRVEIRLNEEEYALFKNKAAKYPSMTGLIIHAVEAFDERGGVNKIDILNDWANKITDFKTEINRIGNNVNQIAHYLNQLKYQGIYSDAAIDVFNQQLAVYLEIMKSVKNGQDRMNEKLIKSKL